jgi:phage terminase small subunit
MAGRNAKPIKLQLLQGNKGHRTKKQIESRKKSEIKLGDENIHCPQYVKKDLIAFTKWQECISIYTDTDFLTSADVGHLARYCKAHSEYLDLLNHREQIEHIDALSLRDEQTAGAVIEIQSGEKATINLFKKIDYILSVNGILQIDMAINKKMEQLIKMEDRLFLNPLARIKNIAKEAKEKEPEIKDEFAAI